MDLTRDINLHKEVWGEGHLRRVEDQLVEEAAELITVLLRKHRSDRVVTAIDLQSEIADVEICIAYFKKTLDPDTYNSVLVKKLDKLRESLVRLIHEKGIIE